MFYLTHQKGGLYTKRVKENTNTASAVGLVFELTTTLRFKHQAPGSATYEAAVCSLGDSVDR
jgi:hypothetical protein